MREGVYDRVETGKNNETERSAHLAIRVILKSPSLKRGEEGEVTERSQ